MATSNKDLLSERTVTNSAQAGNTQHSAPARADDIRARPGHCSEKETGATPAAEPSRGDKKREWLVIEDSRKNSVFAPDEANLPSGYIPRDVAERVLGKSMAGTVWFTREESTKLREQPEWKTHLDDPFNCPECGAHDFGLNRPSCPHCGFTIMQSRVTSPQEGK